MANNEVIKLLTQLHDKEEFEIFAPYDQKENRKADRRLYPCSVNTVDFEVLKQRNTEKRAIWFTPNSMFKGKRSKLSVTRHNAITLDKDFQGTKEEIADLKKGYFQNLINLQLQPTVIIETKRGFQPMWFLQKGTITDNQQFETLQKMMQEKLGTDPQAIGAERVYRLPGFYHWKDVNDPFFIRLVHVDYTKRYTKDELIHKYGGKKKFTSVKKKHTTGRLSGKPVSIKEFKGNGDIKDIFKGCEVFGKLQSRKDPSHHERFALASTLINLGQDGFDHVCSIARNWNDYDKDYTAYQISQIISRGYLPVTCEWLIKNGICKGRCVNIKQNRRPLDFYHHPVKDLPERNGKRDYYPIANLPVTKDQQNITDEIVKIMKNRNQTVGVTHKQALRDISRIMSAPVYNDKPIVIPAVPGIGKTTFIIAYIKHMLEHKPNYGAVIVVERQETIDEITKKINYDDATGWEKHHAYAMKGYSKDDCKKGYPVYRPSQCRKCAVSYQDCRVKYNFTEQQKYPIVVISHSRLFQMSDKNNLLSNLRKWKVSGGQYVGTSIIDFETKWHKREMLLIDERPQLVENVPTDSRMLDTLLSDVQEYTSEYYSEVLKAVNSIRDCYALPSDFEQIEPLNPQFSWTTDFTEAWGADYLGDYPEYPGLVENIIREGGFYSRHDHTISTTHYSNIYWQDYSTFIYDGTASLDPDYKDDKFYFLNLPQLRPYTNLTINACMDQNLSKAFYTEHPDFVIKFSENIKEIAKSGNTYVACYKDYEEEYKKQLENVENISIEHYGSTKGANHLLDNVNIVCTGILNKGESYYLSKTIAITGAISSYQSTTEDRVRRFNDKNAESLKVYEMVTELVQEIFRTQLRNHSSDQKINVYLCSRDANLINVLGDNFPGCKVSRDWEPKALLNNRELFREFVEEHGDDYKTKTKLVRAFLDKGYSLNSNDICEVLGVNKDHAARYLK